MPAPNKATSQIFGKPKVGQMVTDLDTKKQFQYIPSNLGYFIAFWVMFVLGVVMLLGMLFWGWNLLFAALWPEWYGGMANLYLIVMILLFFLSALSLGKADLYESIQTDGKSRKVQPMGHNPFVN